MTQGVTKILVTGFEPFGEDSMNSSQRIVDALTGDENIVVRVLPVDRDRAGEALQQCLEDEAPEAVLCLGQACDRHEVTPEKVAVNLCAFRIPDNSGNQPLDEQVAAIREAIRVTRTAPRRNLLRSTGAAPLP